MKTSNKNSELQNKIVDLTEKLHKVNEKLKESEAFKGHFISNITNEIVNPFASILGLSQNILSLKEGDIEKAKSMANLIYFEAFNLDYQLNNIFVAAKIEAGEIIPEILNVDIHKLIQNSIKIFKFLANKKRLSIEFNYKISADLKKIYYFKTDPEKLKLILSNIIGNSIKYSNESGKLQVNTWIEDGNLKITIRDYGKGIDAAGKKVVFDRFKQLDSNINTINSGYGLGLSVTKALVDILDGNIKIISEEGKGAEFIITIPEAKSFTEDIASDADEIYFEDNEIF